MRAYRDAGQSSGPKSVGCFPWGEVGPRLTQCRLGRSIFPFQVVSWFIQPIGHRHGPKSGEAYFQSPKIVGRPQPQTISAIVVAIVAEKNYIQEVGAKQQKILRYWTKYAFFAYHLVYQFSPLVASRPRGVMLPSFVPFLAHLSSTKYLSFVCRFVEPFRSCMLPIDGGSANVWRNLRFPLPNF